MPFAELVSNFLFSLIEYLPILIVLMVILKGNFSKLIQFAMELITAIFKLLFKLLGIILQGGKDQSIRRKRDAQRKAERRKAKDRRIQQELALSQGEYAQRNTTITRQVPRSSTQEPTRPTKSNPWAAGNPGQRVNTVRQEKAVRSHQPERTANKDALGRDLPTTPAPVQVQDRAQNLPDPTVIVRHDVPEVSIQKHSKKPNETRRKVEILLRENNVKSAFLFKELIDKPKALR